ncbi:MAG: hypothetical protein JW940_38625 [Polyangiaceae bacterium]|nr:hypothetical protein [Polyangiaceae bacterium]
MNVALFAPSCGARRAQNGGPFAGIGYGPFDAVEAVVSTPRPCSAVLAAWRA